MPISLTRKHIQIIALSSGIVMLAAVICVLMQNYAQRWLLDRGVAILSERIGTVVRIDSVAVSLVGRKVTVYGMEVEDRSGKSMLVIDTLGAKVELFPLLRSRYVVNSLRLSGVTAVLYKERKDSAANYQFLLDTFRSSADSTADSGRNPRHDKPDVELQTAELRGMRLRWDVFSERVKGGDTLDASHLCIENLHVKVDGVVQKHGNLTVTLSDIGGREKKSGIALTAAGAGYRSLQQRDVTLELRRLQCVQGGKRVGFSRLSAYQQRGHLSLALPMNLHIDSLTYCYDNGKPHKRTGKPHRGYFDTGHLNAVMNVEADMDYITSDSVRGRLTRLSAYDRASGLHIRNLTAVVSKEHDTLTAQEICLNLPRTAIKSERIETHLLRDSMGRVTDLAVMPSLFSAKVVLRDISKPFAPVLSDFTTPLNLTVRTGGTLTKLLFSDIRVSTPDKRLRLTANGEMCDVLKKRALRLHFRNIKLDARKGIKEIIIGHFSKKVRMKMVRQMRKIGDIRYYGSMGVYFKREDFTGTLFTKYGNADFSFTINGKTKYMTGTITTDSLGLGSVMNVKGLSSIRASATYGFNVASKRKRPVKNNGRLPIGWMKAHIDSARFKGVNFSNVSAMMHSDGATAMGELYLPKKLFDISLLFWYTQTDSLQELRFKPRVMKHQKAPPLLTNTRKWKDYMNEARQRAKTRNMKKN